ncbi:MAG: hypothetical protein JNL36_08025 [Candidatus Kapabacteria bacterium]|jgi:hypothetical protein|nr:hypothetical protein [Candidatus Kapabacteria bacterium]
MHQDLQKLIDLLKRANSLLSEFSGGYSGEFMSAEEFHEKLTEVITYLEESKLEYLLDILVWFVPVSCWDDFVGIHDTEKLADQIYELAMKLYKPEKL